jgi:Cu2+-containing amine oxidase
LDYSKIVADPLVPTQNQKVSMSTYLVIDHPLTGLTNAEIKQVVDGLTAYLTATSGAKVTSIVGGES